MCVCILYVSVCLFTGDLCSSAHFNWNRLLHRAFSSVSIVWWNKEKKSVYLISCFIIITIKRSVGGIFLFSVWRRRPWLGNNEYFFCIRHLQSSVFEINKKKTHTQYILKKAPPLFSFDLNALNSHWEMAFFSLFAVFFSIVESSVEKKRSRFAISLVIQRST